jgi:hypothetical protein
MLKNREFSCSVRIDFHKYSFIHNFLLFASNLSHAICFQFGFLFRSSESIMSMASKKSTHASSHMNGTFSGGVCCQVVTILPL